MSDNRYSITGVVMEIFPLRVISNYFKKTPVKIRTSDIDFTGKVNERHIIIDFVNDDIHLLESIKAGYTVQIQFLIDGRDLKTKEGKEFNITALVGFDIVVISAGDDATKEDKDAVITANGLEHKEIIMAAKIDEVIRQNFDNYKVEDPLFGDIGKKQDEPINSFDPLPF